MTRDWCNRQTLKSAEAAIAFLGPGLGRMRREMVCVAHLDSEHGLIELRLSYARDVGCINLPIRTIVADALALGSDGLIVAHNHPSGTARPSESDVMATRLLASIVRPLGLRLHDHLVFGGSECFSFRGMGLL